MSSFDSLGTTRAYLDHVTVDKNTKLIGRVSSYFAFKGFGFISPEGNSDGKDWFVHLSTLERSGINRIMKGQRVSFSLLPSSYNRDGYKTVDVSLIEPLIPPTQRLMAAKWKQAVLKWLNPKKGFGELEVDGILGNVMLHANEVHDSGIVKLSEDMKFEVITSENSRPGSHFKYVTEAIRMPT